MPRTPVIETLVIDNFQGMGTLFKFGNINSGKGYLQVNSGQNPFVKPGQLTWAEAPVQIDSAGSVITDMIVAGKERVESGILYVYAIGHTGRLYKIQVNDPTTYNPNYDNPVLLATLTSGTPTFTRGGFIDFFGATEQIYIGHDKGVTRINFDGTSESAISGTWEQTVPRPLKQFVGKLYIGNGSNIAEIDSTGTVTSSTKLSPGFPTGTQVRDMDFSVDGNYLEIVVSRLALEDITSSTQQTTRTSNVEGYVFKWNGTDTGYTTFDYYPSFAINANITFQNYQYRFGVDQFGAAIYNPTEKIITEAELAPPLPNAIASTGNLFLKMTPLYFNGVLEADLYAWGHADFEVGQPYGYWDLFFINATSPETDIIQVPFLLPVSNTGLGASSNNYTNNLFGISKMYFSTLETSVTPTTAYRLYKWTPIVSFQVQSTNALIGAVYQTQTQMFSKRIKIKEVRIYANPWENGASFQIDLIGPDDSVISGSSRVFDTADGTLTVGEDFAWYNPQMDKTYAIAVLITNLGSVNHVINKIEIDFTAGGE